MKRKKGLLFIWDKIKELATPIRLERGGDGG